MRLGNTFIILFVVIQVIAQCNCDGESTTQTPATKPGEETTTPTEAPNPTEPSNPTDPPKPESSVVLNFVNNLGYQWYPVSKTDNKLCEVGKEAGCLGGLACLCKQLLEKKDPLLSAGNTLTDSTAKTDHFKVMKFDPALKALNVLKTYNLQALVMGPDLYRYGGSLANQFVEKIQAEKLACNLNSTAKEPFKPFVDIPAKSGSPCGIRVIGFANADIMARLNPESLNASDEVDAITKTIESTQRGKNLIVVMGEGSKELAKNISAIKEVDLVLMSGSNVTDGELLEKVTENERLKFILSKELTGTYAQLTVQLSNECKITEGTVAKEFPYNNLDATSEQCKIAVDADKKAIDEAVTAGVTAYQNYEKDLSVKLLTTLSTESCFKYECTIGSMAADAVASAVATKSKDSPLESRAVLLPAAIFKNATLAEPVSLKSLQELFLDDEIFYTVNLTAIELKEIVEMLVRNSSGVNTPQLSGFRLFVDLNGAPNEKVDLLHILGSHLMFENVRFNDKERVYRVVLPLNSLLRNGLKNADSHPHEVTDVFLSEAVASWFRSESSDGRPLLPPPLGERITYVLLPTQGRCENLIAITVCYTFLAVITLCSLLLLSYKIYSDRTAVHYVR